MKKILTIVALSLVGLLVVTTIVLGFIPSNFAQVSVTEAVSLTYHNGSAHQIYYKGEDEEFDDLVELFEEQSKQSVLKSLFTGAYSNDADVVNETTSMTSKLTSGQWLVYRFDNAQTLYIDGEKYEDDTLGEENTVEYKKLALSVTETDGLQLVTMYIFDSKDATVSTHTVKVYADLTATISYINELEII